MKSNIVFAIILSSLLSLSTPVWGSAESEEIQQQFTLKNTVITTEESYIELDYPFYYNNVIDDVARELSLYYIAPNTNAEIKIGSANPIDIWLDGNPLSHTYDGSHNNYQNGYLVFPDIVGSNIGDKNDIIWKKIRWYYPANLHGERILFIARLHWTCDYINGEKNTNWVHHEHNFEVQNKVLLPAIDFKSVGVALDKTDCNTLQASLTAHSATAKHNIETRKFLFKGNAIEDKTFDLTNGSNVDLRILEGQVTYPDQLSWSYHYTPAVHDSDSAQITKNEAILKMITSVKSGTSDFNTHARITGLSAQIDACDGVITVTATASKNFTGNSTLVFDLYELEEGKSEPSTSELSRTEKSLYQHTSKSSYTATIKNVSIDKRYLLKAYIMYDNLKEDCLPITCIINKPEMKALLNVESVEVEGKGNDLAVKVTWSKLDCNNVTYVLKRINAQTPETTKIITEDLNTLSSFTDTDIEPCAVYSYWVEATLPAFISERTLVSKKQEIYVPQQKILENLTVEKGQSQSGVRLYFNLLATDFVHSVAISRRTLNSTKETAATDTIYRFYAGDISKDMTWMDEGAQPGVLYDYSVTVIPTSSCHSESLRSTGFRDASATINGNIAYKSASTASPLVDVEAIPNGGNCQFSTSRSLVLSGSNIGVVKMGALAKDSINFNKDFTWQAWIKPGNNESGSENVKEICNKTIFACQDIAIFIDNNENLHCGIGKDPYNTTNKLSVPFQKKEHFRHVTFTRRSDKLYLYIDGIAKDSSDTLSPSTVEDPLGTTDNSDLFAYIGARYTKAGNTIEKESAFRGNIDELRLWAKALSDIGVKDSYNSILNGEEEGLLAYWKFDEGTQDFYDRSREPYRGLRGSNGVIRGGYESTGSDLFPEELRYRTRTDKYGNYILSGLPFESNGTSYIVVPKKGNHVFMPVNKNLFIDQYNAVVNNVDFADQSSFKVKIKVLYEGTNYPVQGATCSINGVTVTSEGQIVATNNEGVLILSVPYGKQKIKVEKGNHTFVKDTVSILVEEDITTPIIFYDKTKVKIAGRVVGGTRESQKEIGFGLSKNNIGARKINLTYDIYAHPGSTLLPEGIFSKTDSLSHKSIDYITINPEDNQKRDTVFRVNRTFVTTGVSNGNSIVSITPDSQTGEYECYLIPEIFKVVEVEFYNGSLASFKNVTDLNLQGAFENIMVSNEYEIRKQNESEHTKEKETYSYNYRRDFIYRSLPKMEIAQSGITPIAGIPFYGVDTLEMDGAVACPMINKKEDGTQIYTKPDGSTVTETIYSGHYATNFPVFVQEEHVKFRIKGYELYTKQDISGSEVRDEVPLSDISVMISNSFTDDPREKDCVIKFEPGNNWVDYSFMVGTPSGNEDTFFPEKSYTSVFTAQYFFNDKPTVLYEVETPINARHKDDKNGQIRGYHLGLIQSESNNFITKGPDKILAVLRDPPGTNSSTTLQKGSVISKSLAKHKLSYRSAEGTFTGGIHVGGTGGIFSTDEKIDVTILGGLKFTYESKKDSLLQYVETITTTEDISTSSSADFINSSGDVYVGLATNINYSDADHITFREVSTAPSAKGYPQFTYKGTTYALQAKNVPLLGREYKTQFLYSQSHILDYLLPTLQKQKKELLRYSDKTSEELKTWQPDPSDFPDDETVMFVTNLKPGEKGYGTNNSDPLWAEQSIEGVNGPSYYVKVKTVKDSLQLAENKIYNYNSYISGWQKAIEINEKNKIQSRKQTDMTKNISFDSGITYTYGQEIVTDTIHGYTWEYMVMVLGGGSGEGHILKGAFNIEVFGGGDGIDDKYYDDWNNESSTTNSKTQSYSYTLQDEVKGNYYSVDVITPIQGDGICYSPIFSVQAGQSKCPYQGEDLTKFYKENQNPVTLNYATARIEKPVIQVNGVNSATFSNIPSGERFFFTLNLQNDGEADMMSTFGLKYVDKSNPNSAYIYVDDFLIEGQSFDLQAKKGISKIFSIQQSRTDVTDYDSIGLVLHSLCEMNPGIPGLSSLADTVWVSFHFQPAAPTVSMQASRVVLNSTTKDLSVPITLSKLDANYKDFTGILMQYKAASAQEWTPFEYFVVQEAFSKGDTIGGIPNTIWEERWDQEKAHISCEINFEKLNLPDGVYFVRAQSFLKQFINGNPVEIAQRVTDPIQIVKDTERPEVIGHQPQSGILLPDSEISLSFNEMIDKGLISNENTFTLKGTLNGSQQSHSSGLLMDGVTDYAETEISTSLSWMDRTIELWIYPLESRQQVLLSHGSQDEFIELILTKEGGLVLRIKKEKTAVKEYTCTENMLLKPNMWSHIAIRFEKSDSRINVLCMGNNLVKTVLDQSIPAEDSVSPYKGYGPFRIGKSMGSNSLFKGRVRDVRIWNRYLSDAEINNNRSSLLSDQAEGLINYWPMDESFGNIAQDKMGWQNMAVYSDWFVSPGGKAALLADNSYLVLDSYAHDITKDKNFSVDFWMRAEGGNNTGTAALFTVGKPYNDGAVDQAGLFIKRGEKVVLCADTDEFTLSDDAASLLDNNWHHIALSVERDGYIQFFKDGVLVKSTPSSVIGGLTNGILTLGACSDSYLACDYFTGSLDGFRIWDKALNNVEVIRWMNKKSLVSEPSVLYYFPFEQRKAGVSQAETTPTLGSQAGVLNAQYEYEARKDTLRLANFPTPEWYSNIAAPIKDDTMEEDLLFKIYKEDQKLYLDISDNSLEKIEGASLDLTLKSNQIHDMNGNTINHSYNFDILVNLKTLKFKEAKKTASQRVGQSTVLEIEVVNLSGKKDYWQINNIPWWLHVSKSSGSLDPYASAIIVATIDPTLPIGLYYEKLSLRGNQRINHSLPLVVKVQGTDPMWHVNPADYDKSMGIIANVYIENCLSLDPEDMLAAFDRSTCVGVTHIDPKTGLAFLNIYSNKQETLTDEQPQALTYKVYDASQDIIYTPLSIKGDSDGIEFQAGAVLGSPSNPKIFTTTQNEEQQISLHKGWNWISTSVKSSENVSELLKNQELFTVSYLKGQAPNTTLQLDTISKEWYGSGFQIAPPDMYKAHVSQPSLLKVAGVRDNAATVQLPEGYKWFGFWRHSPMSVAEAMSKTSANLGDVIISQEGFTIYDPQLGWVGTLTGLEPNKGYIYRNVGEEKSLTYPALRAKSAVTIENIKQSSKASHWSFNPYKYLNSMSVTAIVVGSEEIKDGNYELGAFVGDECRGAVRLTKNDRLDKLLAYLSIYGSGSKETIRFKLYNEDENLEYDLDETLTFSSDKILGSPSSPFILHLSGVGISDLISDKISVYPIPMKDKLQVKATCNITTMRIIDMQGCEIWTGSMDEQYTIDVSHLIPGGYILVVVTDQGIIHKPLLKQE